MHQTCIHTQWSVRTNFPAIALITLTQAADSTMRQFNACDVMMPALTTGVPVSTTLVR
jgi:hypothetical protein